MLDQFVAGSIRRISPETPVPVFCEDSRETFPGGAANVARNVSSLGGSCTVIGVIGDDATGLRLRRELGSIHGIRAHLPVAAGRPTTEKTRLVVRGQHVLRSDREETGPMPSAVEDELRLALETEIERHDVLVLSDYAKGTLSENLVREAIARARAAGIKIVADPKARDLGRYAGSTVITPNSKELEAATGIDPATDDDAAAEAALRAAEVSGAAILVTRAEQGMTLVRAGHAPVHIASVAREVFDVVGAGDTVTAVLALSLAAGADLEQAARIANEAAGIAVGRRGTATVSLDELSAALADRGLGPVERPVGEKLLDQAALLRNVSAWKRDGLRIGFTNGCFDVLHVGHVRLIEFARAHCDRLIVAVNSDGSVGRLKGPGRPLNSQAERMEMLAALSAVDAVVVFEEDTPAQLIAGVLPDVLVKGADYARENIVGADIVLTHGGEVLRFPLVPERSSSGLIRALSGGRA